MTIAAMKQGTSLQTIQTLKDNTGPPPKLYAHTSDPTGEMEHSND